MITADLDAILAGLHRATVAEDWPRVRSMRDRLIEARDRVEAMEQHGTVLPFPAARPAATAVIGNVVRGPWGSVA
ncbi:hypothetical protein [Roseomonas elaeocarpi]|uniref:Uncharacterized protein n=1 Tax=Roseomonas elaeocarpi TaxID=907779 RepID=A0ABV6JZA2_9PROT